MKKRVYQHEARRRFNAVLVVARSERGERSIFDYVVVLTVDDKDAYVEVRGCGADFGTNGYISYVSAMDYRCCVVWAGNRGCWYVFSPDELVRLAAAKTRGGPDVIPFESTSIAIGTGLHDPDKPLPRPAYQDEDLADAVFRAVRRGRGRAEQILIDRLQEEIDSDAEPRVLRDRYSRAASVLPATKGEYVFSFAKMLSDEHMDDASKLAREAIAKTLSEEQIANAERLGSSLRDL